jgi:hypothetical protein
MKMYGTEKKKKKVPFNIKSAYQECLERAGKTWNALQEDCRVAAHFQRFCNDGSFLQYSNYAI